MKNVLLMMAIIGLTGCDGWFQDVTGYIITGLTVDSYPDSDRAWDPDESLNDRSADLTFTVSQGGFVLFDCNCVRADVSSNWLPAYIEADGEFEFPDQEGTYTITLYDNDPATDSREYIGEATVTPSDFLDIANQTVEIPLSGDFIGHLNVDFAYAE